MILDSDRRGIAVVVGHLDAQITAGGIQDHLIDGEPIGDFQMIEAIAGPDHVMAVGRLVAVVAGAADQDIVAETAADGVGAAAAKNNVVAIAGIDTVGVGAADDQGIADHRKGIEGVDDGAGFGAAVAVQVGDQV